MEQNPEKELKEFLDDSHCARDFKCCIEGVGFEHLSKKKDVGIPAYFECLEERPPDCILLMSFDDSYFCECPLRFQLARKLGKQPRRYPSSIATPPHSP